MLNVPCTLRAHIHCYNLAIKRSGRKQGKLDKMNDKLRDDIREFLSDRSIKQIDLMNKHNISRNTLKKYITIVQERYQ